LRVRLPVISGGADVKLFKSQEEKQQIAGAEAGFQQFISSLGDADPDGARALAASFQKTPGIAALGPRARRKLSEVAFRQYAEQVLADDHLTADEEAAFFEVAEAIGWSDADIESSDLYTRLQIAKLNDGRLPSLDAADLHLIPKKGEVVHGETAAALLHEVAVREWRGGSQGVSIRVAKGVRYRVGATRGRLVTVGTQLQVADTGVLSVTSKRVAYLGARKTLDMPYTKVMGIDLYSDAIRFSLSNRQNAPIFRITIDSDLLGALINAAMQVADVR
jgi:hypothetical protein